MYKGINKAKTKTSKLSNSKISQNCGKKNSNFFSKNLRIYQNSDSDKMSKTLTKDLVMAKCRTDNLRMIKKLNLWGNNLTEVSLLREMTALEVLSLPINNISTLKDFVNCLNLRELYIRGNQIRDLAEIRYLQKLPYLRTLWLNENPCSEHPNYRSYVIQMLPELTKLDKTAITDEERKNALYGNGIEVIEQEDSPRGREIEANFNGEIEIDEDEFS